MYPEKTESQVKKEEPETKERAENDEKENLHPSIEIGKPK